MPDRRVAIGVRRWFAGIAVAVLVMTGSIDAQADTLQLCKPLQPGEAKPQLVFCDCPVGCPRMVVIPPGRFTMGSDESEFGRLSNEGPRHEVTLRKPFAVGTFEVTRAEWAACVAGGGCRTTPAPNMRGWTEPNTPVINVTWQDAKEYTAWLARRSGKPYRLLSEAEWEYIARAGAVTTYPTGATITPEQANFAAVGRSARRPVAVGSYPANAFGVSDIMGNVWEWVEDTWHPNYEKAPADGRAWGGGDKRFRVLRGGSWGDGAGDLRVSYRNIYTPETRSDLFGFRVARALAEAELSRGKR